jgi:hypothetical protein
LPLKKKIFLATLIIIGLAGFYLVFTSGRIDVDPYNMVLFVIVFVIIIYMYILIQRYKD